MTGICLTIEVLTPDLVAATSTRYRRRRGIQRTNTASPHDTTPVGFKTSLPEKIKGRFNTTPGTFFDEAADT